MLGSKATHNKVYLSLEGWIRGKLKTTDYNGSSSLSLSPFAFPSGAEWREERGMVDEGDGSSSWDVSVELRLPLPMVILHSVPDVWTQLPTDSSLVSCITPSLHNSLSRVGEDGMEGEWEGFLVLRLACLKLARGGRSRTPLRVEPSIAFWSWKWESEQNHTLVVLKINVQCHRGTK